MQPLKSYLLASAFALPLLVSYTYADTDTPEVVFDCSATPSVCTNMCWGAYCSNYGVTLNFDNPSTDTKNQRRKKAGCKPNPNRCSGGQPNNSCDEYPFASTSDADGVQQVTRCVPASENNSQGARLKNFYKNSLNNKPGQFIVGFGNPDASAVKYCGTPHGCINDGMQYLGNNLAPNGPPGKIKHKRNYYRLQSGMPFLSTRDLAIGTVVKRVVARSEGEMGLMRRAGADPFDLVDDVVVEEI